MVETHTVELVDRDVTLEVPENQSILEAAEEAGIDLPYQCRMGICGVCCAMRESDCDVEQTEGMFLSDSEKEEGYVLTCIARPLSDMKIETDESP
ncbi:2Fe-2S iron-sulfur cluster-binding protein [Halostella pelagica]|uniref:2Fe-2S iron-sulfur cluster-binding protein n=1 Tax=Halostella pelagica TaxID=2583824 RepID=UPI001081EF70|nr:2Fe-2S iron-sulfur cluster-binding protein [Halostella pelagica]